MVIAQSNTNPSTAVVLAVAFVLQVRLMHNILGGVIDPHAAYLLLRGMKTLGLRVEHQNRTAFEIAKRLEAHPKIQRVHYPGLESHPDHDIAVKQMDGFGGVISFEVSSSCGCWCMQPLAIPALVTAVVCGMQTVATHCRLTAKESAAD